MIAWIAILVLQGAHFGSDKQSAKKMWRSALYGYGLAYVHNSITSNAYEFMRSYLHFANNDERILSGEPRYDPIFKVRWLCRLL